MTRAHHVPHDMEGTPLKTWHPPLNAHALRPFPPVSPLSSGMTCPLSSAGCHRERAHAPARGRGHAGGPARAGVPPAAGGAPAQAHGQRATRPPGREGALEAARLGRPLLPDDAPCPHL
uniref:Uncharacterized protein n=1 Tax=Tetraselmis sp. GSL018 TaxID=582737 RepID=A0A061SD14_9CHLO